MVVSRAPAPRLQVVLEVGVPTCDAGYRVERRFRKRGAAEIGVQNHPGAVDDRPKRWNVGDTEAFLHSGGVEPRVFHAAPKGSGINALAELAANPVELCPKLLDHQPTRMGLQNRDERLGLEESL
jgi:hypothetical protein